jgi:hypothetical protein
MDTTTQHGYNNTIAQHNDTTLLQHNTPTQHGYSNTTQHNMVTTQQHNTTTQHNMATTTQHGYNNTTWLQHNNNMATILPSDRASGSCLYHALCPTTGDNPILLSVLMLVSGTFQVGCCP